MGHSTLEQAAWQALRRSPVQLTQAAADIPPFLRNAAKQKPENQRTGMLPAAAVSALTAAGQDADTAWQAVLQAIASRFPAFAGSWQQYISSGGFLLDLWCLPPERRAELVARLKLERVMQLAEQAAADPVMALANLPLLQELSQLTRRVENREDPQHPAHVMLLEAHGFPPELATAVLLYSRSVPWWVHPILSVMVLICLGVFILAIADPHSEVFNTQDCHGANWVHYTVLPLFVLGMSWVEAYLLRNRQRWDKAWRDALTAWRSSVQ
jgi:hypothetical protein